MKLNKKGTTLIELVIVLALIGFASLIAFSFYFFSARTFAKGSSQTEAQFDIRMVTQFITEEVRNSVTLDIVVKPNTFTANDTYNYIYVLNKQMYYRKANETIGNLLYDIQIENYTFALEKSVSKSGNSVNLLHVYINGKNENQVFSVDTEFLLNNIASMPAKTGSDANTLNAIKFKKR